MGARLVRPRTRPRGLRGRRREGGCRFRCYLWILTTWWVSPYQVQQGEGIIMALTIYSYSTRSGIIEFQFPALMGDSLYPSPHLGCFFKSLHESHESAVPSCVFPLIKQANMISESLVVFVCATTGQGDPPDNMKVIEKITGSLGFGWPVFLIV